MSDSLGRLVVDLAQQHGDRPAFGHLGQSISYTEVEVLSRRVAAWFQNHTDLKPGDRIAIQLPNCMQYPVALFGALRAGLVVVNTNPLYTDDELRSQLQDSGARALLVYDPLSAPASRVLGGTSIDYVITTQIGDLHPGWRRWALNCYAHYRRRSRRRVRGSIPFSRVLMAESGSHWRAPDPQELALLQYTGGTTGPAKGAMLTHESLMANVEQLKQRLQDARLSPEMKLLQPLPVYHIYAFMLTLLMYSQGSYVELIPDPQDGKRLAKAFDRVRPSCFAGINPLFIALCRNADFNQLDFSSLQLTISGGMALTESAARHWREVTGCAITEGYGLTECSPVVSVAKPGEEKTGSAGTPLAGTDVRIVDEAGELLPSGETGEIQVRGPQLMKGYWNRQDGGEGQMLADGWLATGDIGQLDDGGQIRIIDRRKDMIIVSGFKVYPSELENVISAHPDILECAVIGLPDEECGEFIKLYVVSKNPRLTTRGVREYCRERLTSYKVPRSVEFRHDLPRNSIGKVQRRVLRQEALHELGLDERSGSQQAARLG
ncbi:AMP-binding protein [Marinobacterium sp. YM272]|uniref:AMP-binding protein n=1 Tax=Marinobacterium sp. YM272 TaxID=3421654 RepID=UPI003D7F709D